MDPIIFYDSHERTQLLPLTYLRSTVDLMVGMSTIKQKWLGLLGDVDYSVCTPSYLQGLYPYKKIDEPTTCILIDGACLPNDELLRAIKALQLNEALTSDGRCVVLKAKLSSEENYDRIPRLLGLSRKIEVHADIIKYPEDILHHARTEFIKDYQVKTARKESARLDHTSKHRGDDLFIGAQTKIRDAIINTEEGPVYIDDDAEIMENAVIKGPVYIGPKSKIHVGAKVYADTMLGEQCRIGGEIKRTTILGHSNKAHDGYLGDSVVARWCNLGANTNNSNLKNTYGKVSLWDASANAYRATDLQFLGMILGDHTMAAINTSFNTGSVTGIFVNIFDQTPERFIPSFSWGKDDTYRVDKGIDVAKLMFERRGLLMPIAYESAVRYLASQ